MWASAVWDVLKSQVTLLTIVTTLAAAISGLVSIVVSSRIKASFDTALEDYKFQLKQREQAAKVSEYFSLALFLKESDDPDLYRRANQLAWELLIWLPEKTYQDVKKGVQGDANATAQAVIATRRQLLGSMAGSLGPDDIIVHGPGIGRAGSTTPSTRQ